MTNTQVLKSLRNAIWIWKAALIASLGLLIVQGLLLLRLIGGWSTSENILTFLAFPAVLAGALRIVAISYLSIHKPKLFHFALAPFLATLLLSDGALSAPDFGTRITVAVFGLLAELLILAAIFRALQSERAVE